MPRPRTVVPLVALATATVAHLRSRARRDPHAERIAQLDAQADHEEIGAITATYVWPWDVETALSLALFRTYAVPTVSRILADSGAFTTDTRKRYDDTELLLAEPQEHGYDSPRGRAALRRINRMHAAYPIRPIDLTYVLSTFVAEPTRFIARYGWRDLTDHEREALWRYWRELGARMGVPDLPATWQEFLDWNAAFEHAEFRYDPANHAVADATMTMYLTEVYRVPARLVPAVRPAVLALLEPFVVDALGYDQPPRWLRQVVPTTLRLRGRLQRWFLPARRTPVRITQRQRPTYPGGYAIEQLGTFPDPDQAAKAGTRDGVAPAKVPSRIDAPVAAVAGPAPR